MIPKWSFTYFQVQDNAMNYFHLLANHVPPSNPLKSLAMRMRDCSLPGVRACPSPATGTGTPAPPLTRRAAALPASVLHFGLL